MQFISPPMRAHSCFGYFFLQDLLSMKCFSKLLPRTETVSDSVLRMIYLHALHSCEVMVRLSGLDQEDSGSNPHSTMKHTG